MALFLSDRLTSASGSVGGATYSRNRAGLYIRARRVPVNPNSSDQQRARAALSSAAAAFRGLDPEDRIAWDNFAALTPAVNRLGQPIQLTGFNWFVAANAMLVQLGLPAVESAPSTPGRVPLAEPSAIALDEAGSISLTGVGTPANGSVLGVFVGRPLPGSIRYYNGPFQLVGFDTVAAGNFSAENLTGYNGEDLANGQEIVVRIAGANPDGRLTTVIQRRVLVTGGG